MHRRLKKTLKSAAKPVSVFIIPHSGLPSLRFNLPVALLLALGVFWTGLTVWAGYIAGRQFDYYITRVDNKILRAKMSDVSQQVEKGLAYLEMTKKTDRQLRKMLGMNPNLVDESDSVGGPTASDLSDFRKLLSNRASEIRETSLNNSIFKMQEESRRRLSSYAEVTWYITNEHNTARATPAIWPVSGRITSSYGYRIAPLRIASEYHTGIDIANEPGTPVHATADGVVRYSGWANGYGLSMVLDHGFAYSTLYGHLSELLVKEGAQVLRGQIIGRVGSTGTSTGPHLHYEVWLDGLPKNPVRYLQIDNKNRPLATIFESIFS